MPEFIAETYAPRDAPGTHTAARGADDAALAADQVSQSEAQVRLLGAIVVPEEETCFYLYPTAISDVWVLTRVHGVATRNRVPAFSRTLIAARGRSAGGSRACSRPGRGVSARGHTSCLGPATITPA